MRKEVVLGSRHGNLIIIAEAESIPGRKKSKTVLHRAVQCRCDCGNVTVVKLSNLPKTISCGCHKREMMRAVAAERFTVHGASRHPLFKLWMHVMDRCENPADKSYPNYGGRGIELCERWHDPWLFIQDIEREIGLPPDRRTLGGMPLYSLNRIDNDGNYEPGNVEWADWLAQARNSRGHLLRTPVERGARYGRLSVLREIEPKVVQNSSKAGGVARHRAVLCRCDCGNEIQVLLSSLSQGRTSSCGCYRKEVATARLRQLWGGDG